ncbi:peptidase M20 [Aureimonas sp. SA4125]|uniref:M20 family metallopeptidase n=1 Tax=Aureimonas sp. SA4125 TaxID=2826993 RepID=UPI001CC4D7DF|nr:M20 family metallopeptidase [Aureimonas sp. SA4125]BDA86551.1 peptidase M20 [Aureimonas sp. SA4125]
MGSALDTEAPVLDWLAARVPDMEALLCDLVSIDSNSTDAAGVAAVATRLEKFLHSANVEVSRISSGSDAPLLAAGVPGAASVAPALMLGHMDTVFPMGAAAARPFRVAGNQLHGPGVADMKAGLVIEAFVLAALAATTTPARPVTALFTVDEEIASPLSHLHIHAAARTAAFVLNAEPGRANGNVVIERKGGMFGWLSVTGRASHAGIDFPAGASAITELAHKIVDLERLTDLDSGITVNVGLVEGGQSINTVAPDARAGIDIRYATPDQRSNLLQAIDAIVSLNRDAATSAAFDVIGEFHPMVPSEGSRALLAVYQSAAATLGFAAEGEATGGCSDAGFAASLGIPTLCGLGPVGGKAHTEAEYVERGSILPRAQALALTLLRFPLDPPELDTGSRRPLFNPPTDR